MNETDERIGNCKLPPFWKSDGSVGHLEKCPREDPDETEIDSCEKCPYWVWET